MLYVVIAYCHIGSELELVYQENQNAFLQSFRQTEEEIMNTVSVRMSTIDLFDRGLLGTRRVDKGLVQRLLETLYFDQLPPEVTGSVEKMHAI